MAFEIATALIGLSGAVIGGAISSLTAILIARNERQKFRQERSWDLRREAYTVIIGALDRARAIMQHIADEYGDEPFAWDASDENRKAQTQMVEYFHVARNTFHANRLMLSKAFVAKYDEMNRKLEPDDPNAMPPESAELAASVMQRMVPEMEELALRELGVRS